MTFIDDVNSDLRYIIDDSFGDNRKSYLALNCYKEKLKNSINKLSLYGNNIIDIETLNTINKLIDDPNIINDIIHIQDDMQFQEEYTQVKYIKFTIYNYKLILYV